MFKLENLIGVPSVINFGGIIRNTVKECDIKKLPHKTPRIKIITAVLRLTSRKVKKPKKTKEQTKMQLLESLPSVDANMSIAVETTTQEVKPKVRKRKSTLLPVPRTHDALHDYEDQDFQSEIEEVIEILRRALANMSSDGETRELYSAVNVFVKSGFQKFKEHRKHIEKAMLHIHTRKLLKNEIDAVERGRLKKNLAIVNVVRSAINKLNEINAIYKLNKQDVAEQKNKEHSVITR